MEELKFNNNRTKALETYLSIVRDSYETSGCVRTQHLNLALEIAEVVMREMTEVTREVTIVSDAMGDSVLNRPTWTVYWVEI